jgi:NADPH:quinone reductase-like Zn-dependent oxidoreductase
MATAINDYDWSMVTGKPAIYRLFMGLFKPKHSTPGMELSGIVEQVGKGVTSFQEGDPVYGDISEFGFGTFAEYISLPPAALGLKPETMSFEDAAALPHAALLAYQGLMEKGELREGQRILINGAGGGVGTLACQMARQYRCHITGVDSGAKIETLKGLGFDEFIDYQKEDFTASGKSYDLILDCKTNRNPGSYLRALAPGGRYVTVGGEPFRLIQLLVAGLFSRNKKLFILALKPNRGLDRINQLFLAGVLKPVIDGPYTFEEIPALVRRFGEGRHTGKIVVRVA